MMKRMVFFVFFLLLVNLANAGFLEILEENLLEDYSLKEMRYFNWTVLHIVENYVDQKRVNPYEMFKAALRGIEKAVPEIVIKFNEETNKLEVAMGDNGLSIKIKKPAIIWENTILIKPVFNFVDENVKDRKRLYEVEFSAINEMLSELDPHSNFLNALQCNELRISTVGKFGGLGILIQSKNGYITVVSPLKGTPAHKAGIKSGDRIIRIGNESAVNMTLDEAVNRLRGEPGTEVTIYVMRDDWTEPKKMVLIREEIKTRSVDKLLLGNEKDERKVAYIKINGFSDETYEDVRSAYKSLKKDAKRNLIGVIIDLRDNPGGLLDASVKVSDMFLKNGLIVSTQAKDGEKVEEKKAYEDNNDIDIPMAVLINRGSASASEIVAGALKDNNRAIIIGQTSFGKGSVQILYDRAASRDEQERLKNYKLTQPAKDCLKLTIAEYMTPRNVSIQSIGITPDVYLVPQLVQKYSMNMYYFPRYSSEVKLEKHLESSRPPDDKPFIILPYVYEKEDNEEEDEDPYSKDIKEDFEIRFAKEILFNGKTNNRMELIDVAKKMRDSYYDAENKKFMEILYKRGIDFSKGESGNLDVEMSVAYKQIVYKDQEKKDSIKKEEKTIEKVEMVNSEILKAGSDYFINFKLKNKSDKPIYRLSGIIESHDPVLNGKEIFWGHIPAGGIREYDVMVRFSKSFPRVAIPYRVRFLSNGKYLEKSFERVLKVNSAPQPRYVLLYQISDNGENSNKNGKIEKGETINISTEVKNTGDGDAINSRVSLQNQSGKAVFLKNGMCSFPKIKKGEKQSCDLQFTLRYELNSDLKFKLYVTDDVFYEESSVMLSLPSATPLQNLALGKIDPPIIKIVSAPEQEIINSKTANIVFSVFNLQGGEDIYIRVNDNKVFYQKNSGMKDFIENIKAEVPLKEGFNNVYIFVRVSEEQYVYKRVVITTPKQFEQNDIIAGQN